MSLAAGAALADLLDVRFVYLLGAVLLFGAAAYGLMTVRRGCAADWAAEGGEPASREQ